MNKATLVITDVLELGPIDFEGLSIDTTVEMEVVRYGDHYAIESSSFGENPFYAVTAFGHSVRLDLTGNDSFKKRLEKAVEAKAIELAKKTDSSKWDSVEFNRVKDRTDEV